MSTSSNKPDLVKLYADLNSIRVALATEDFLTAGEAALDLALQLLPVDFLKNFLTDKAAHDAVTVADVAEEAKLASEGKESAQADELPETEPE